MRIIKFRGKRLDNSTWAYGGSIIHFHQEEGKECNLVFIPQFDEKIFCSTDENGNITDMDHGICYRVDPDTVGQFTGIYDKNGTPIYEGDILRNHFFDEDNGHGVVTYNDGAFEISNPIKTVTFHENLWGKDVEVIGNIYNNPELIGGDEE